MYQYINIVLQAHIYIHLLLYTDLFATFVRESKLYCLLFFVLLVCSTSSAQSDYTELLGLSYSGRVQLFDTVILRSLSHGDSAAYVSELEKVSKLAKEHNDHGLYIEAELAKLNKVPKSQSEKYVECFELLLSYAEKHQLKNYSIGLRFLYGMHLFFYCGDKIGGLKQFAINKSDVLAVSSIDMANKKAILVSLGEVYYVFKNYKLSKEFLLTADTIHNDWRKDVSLRCKNTLGLIYRTRSSYDTAISYFEQARALAKEKNLPVWIGITTGNIGISHYLNGEYDKAIPLIKEDISICIDEKEFTNAVNSMTKLADIYIQKGDPNVAKYWIDNAWKYFDSCDFFTTMSLASLYDLNAQYYRSISNYKTALLYRDSADAYTDSVNEKFNSAITEQVQKQIDDERASVLMSKLNYDKAKMRLTRNGLIAGVVLVAIIAWLIVARQRLAYSTKQALMEADQKLIASELDAAQKQLTDFTKRLKEKNKVIEAFAEDVKNIKAESAANEDKENILPQLLNATILTEEEWSEFKKLFEKVHTGYITRIQHRFPDISQSDLRFLVLSKLGLNNKEMAAILGVRPDTLRTNKYRFRKKIGISTDDELNEIIFNM